MSALNDEARAGAPPAAEPTEPAPAAAPAAPAAAPTAAPAAPRPWWRQPALWLALAALALAGANWWVSRGELQGVQGQVAARLAETDAVAKESRTLARQNQELIQNMQGKLGAVEALVAESRSQQLALEAMYQELTRIGDERITAEVEEAVGAAVQQLQLGGHVEGALLALQNAETRLAAADNPVFLPLRKAITRDMEALKALPLVDMAGVSVKLESIVTAVDGMPLTYAAKPRAEPPPPEGDVLTPGFWQALAGEIWRELRQLVRVERLDRPDPALLAPEHAVFLRENLKLRLVNARLALLQRDTRSFREDVRQARQWIERYFDNEHRGVASALATLGQLADAELQLDVPTLEASRTALHTLKTGRGRAAAR